MIDRFAAAAFGPLACAAMGIPAVDLPELLYEDKGIDMCIGMCTDMCIDMCIDMSELRYQHKFTHMCMTVCMIMCTEMCIDMCIDMSELLYEDKGISMCIDMRGRHALDIVPHATSKVEIDQQSGGILVYCCQCAIADC